MFNRNYLQRRRLIEGFAGAAMLLSGTATVLTSLIAATIPYDHHGEENTFISSAVCGGIFLLATASLLVNKFCCREIEHETIPLASTPRPA